MLDVRERQRLNIKGLNLEQSASPAKSPFDPEIDIPETNWMVIKTWLKNQFPLTATPGSLEDFFTVATRSFLLSPQRREELNLSDKLFERRIHELNSAFNMARWEEKPAQWRYILPTAVDVKLAFPQHHQEFRLRESDWSTAYQQMKETTNTLPERIRLGFNALIMFPQYYHRDASGYVSKEELAAYFKALSKKDWGLNANEVEDVGKGRVIASEVDPSTYFANQHWKISLEQLKRPLTHPDKEAVSYLVTAHSLQLATADEVTVNQQGLVITPFAPPIQLQSIPAIPDQRRF